MAHAIITGGSSGIGAATAQTLNGQGWDVTVLALPDTDLEKSANKARSSEYGRFQCLAVDVTDRDAVHKAVADAEAAFGPTELLVTCAGIARPGRFMDLAVDDFRNQMNVNFHGTVHAVSAVYPGMKSRKSGRIGLISSGAGLCGIFGHTAYAPTKFAVRGFGEALRAEARPFRISVTLCYLPDTDTPQMRANEGVRPAECARISGASHPWPSKEIGKRVAQGVVSRKRCVAPGWEMAALVRFSDPLAGVLRWWFDKSVAAVPAGNDA